eukprot:686537-Pyramimonas_sp.AAC.1
MQAAAVAAKAGGHGVAMLVYLRPPGAFPESSMCRFLVRLQTPCFPRHVRHRSVGLPPCQTPTRVAFFQGAPY